MSTIRPRQLTAFKSGIPALDRWQADVIAIINPFLRIVAEMSATPSGGSGTVTSVTGTAPISVATGTTTPVVSHDASGVTPGTFGDGTHVARVTVDAKGHVTGASEVAITGAAPTGAAGGDLAGSYPNPSLAAAGTAGTYGDAATVPVFTTDTKGRVTGVVATAIAIAQSAVSGLVAALGLKADKATTIGTTAPLSGGGDLSANRTLTHDTAGSAGTKGSASKVPVFQTNATGHVTGNTDTDIAIAASQVTSGLLPVVRGGNTPMVMAVDEVESTGTWLVVGSASIASSNYPTGIVFTAEGFVGATGWTLEVALYNLTDASTLDTRTISAVGTTTAYASGTLSPASGTKMYEIRIRRQGSGSLPSYGQLTRASISAA